MEIAFILLAAGSGERLGSEIPKALVRLNDTPMFIHSLIKAKEAGIFNRFILVVPQGFEDDFQAALSKYSINIDKIILGGAKRVDSVSNALDVIEDVDYVFIHDAARPFLSVKLIESLLEETKEHPAVIPSLVINSTLKLSKDGFVLKTLTRDSICTAQTPQVFDIRLLKSALSKFKESNMSGEIFDDAYLVELSGDRVKLIEGDISNFKITNPQDLEFANRILKECR